MFSASLVPFDTRSARPCSYGLMLPRWLLVRRMCATIKFFAKYRSVSYSYLNVSLRRVRRVRVVIWKTKVWR